MNRFPLLPTLLLPLLAACTAANHPPESATPRWDQVSVECRALSVTDEFFKEIGRPHSGPRFETVLLDNYNLNTWIAATQTDSRAMTIDSPRITVLTGKSGTIVLEEQQHFLTSFIDPSNPSPPAPDSMNLSIDLVVKESPDHQHLVTIRRFYPTTLPNPATGSYQLSVDVPEGLPLQFVAPDKGVIAVLGLRDKRGPIPPERELILLLRLQGIIPKEIEPNLFGPEHDRPTGLPNSPPTAIPAPATTPTLR